MNHFVSLHDNNGTYIDVCEKFSQMTGYGKEELIGKSAYDFIDTSYFREVSKSHMGDDYTVVDYKFKHKDGSLIDLKTHSYKLDNNIVCVTRKLTMYDKIRDVIHSILFPYS